MASLSEQIREIVKAQNVSTYAIAKRLGTSETLVARFLSGERGLSLSTLDMLASMFGIQATVSIQQLPRPTKRGRKPKEKKMAVMFKTKLQEQAFWDNLAIELARDANQNNFSSRRGVFLLTESPSNSGQVICLYNNNPYDDFKRGRSAKRDEETQAFREKLAEHGVNELAYAVWPQKGEEDFGYSYAMIIDAGEDQMEEIKGWMQSILKESRAAASGEGSIGE